MQANHPIGFVLPAKSPEKGLNLYLVQCAHEQADVEIAAVTSAIISHSLITSDQINYSLQTYCHHLTRRYTPILN